MKFNVILFNLIILGTISFIYCKTVIIGDSLFWSGMLFVGGSSSPLVQYLKQKLPDVSFENHALVGAGLHNGYVKSIRQQFNEVKYDSNISGNTLLMDGGGNDIISYRSDCSKWNDKCKKITNESIDIAKGILQEANSFHQIVYLGFYYLEDLINVIDYGNNILGLFCKNEINNCIYVDTRYNATTGKGLKTPGNLSSDGIHPNERGYQILAQMILDETNLI